MDDPASRQPLAKDEVHIWNISLQDVALEYPRLDRPELLSSEEITRYGRILQPIFRQRFLRSRVAMRVILAAYGSQHPEKINYCYNENGKPGIDLPADCRQIKFNLSHSADQCLLAVTREAAIGIDIEYCREGRDYTALAGRFFSQPEQSLLQQSPAAELFYRMWVLKEASVKARGMKLLAGLDRFECRLATDGGLVLSDRCSLQDQSLWSSRLWQPDAGYIAAVAVRNPGAVFYDKTFN